MRSAALQMWLMGAVLVALMVTGVLTLTNIVRDPPDQDLGPAFVVTEDRVPSKLPSPLPIPSTTDRSPEVPTPVLPSKNSPIPSVSAQTSEPTPAPLPDPVASSDPLPPPQPQPEVVPAPPPIIDHDDWDDWDDDYDDDFDDSDD